MQSKKVLLANLEYSKPFIVGTEESYSGLSAYMVQKRKYSSVNHIAFTSRALSKSDQNYSPTKK